jgi:hypothetical protein
MLTGLGLSHFFTPQFRYRFSKVTLYIAIISFLLHLTLYFINLYYPINHSDKLLSTPINAIYTPFSFLLAYEAYLLLYYLPQSTSIYIGKQYEIITLILIRGVFKDITNLNLKLSDSVGEFYNKLWYDLATVILVFALIFLFYKISNRYSSLPAQNNSQTKENAAIQKFISAKKSLSILLLIISFLLGAYSLIDWLFSKPLEHDLQTAIGVNGVFFDHFFSLLIISDVIILLLSLFYTDDYSLIIRNSSFVISTILLKLSFSAHGIMEQILILVGVSFGVTMYAMSNQFEKLKISALRNS